MEEEKLPVWEFAADEKGLSIKVQNIYCNDMYGPEDSFGASVNYNNFVSQFFDECWSFEDVLNTFIYELKQEIEHSIPFDYMPDCWDNYDKNETYLDCIKQAEEKCKEPLKALWKPFCSKRYADENALISKAIAFAIEKHSTVPNKDGTLGQKRKGSNLPYIVHPIEVWQILRNNDCSVEVQIAGLLHDTLEDTSATPQEIAEQFGSRILELVQSESEDKSKTWKERKQHTIDALAHDSIDTMQVCCADKLSNCRAQLYDYRQIGDQLFERFNKQSTPELQAWYYKSIVKALSPLKGMKMYAELCEVIKELYGE